MKMLEGILVLVVIIIVGLYIIVRHPLPIGCLAILIGIGLCCTMTVHGAIAGIILIIVGISFMRFSKIVKTFIDKLISEVKNNNNL